MVIWSPTPPRTNYERTPDARHWSRRFCPSSGKARSAEPVRTAGVSETVQRDDVTDSASAGRRSPQYRDDFGGAGPGHHVDVLHVSERSTSTGDSGAVQQCLPDPARS